MPRLISATVLRRQEEEEDAPGPSAADEDAPDPRPSSPPDDPLPPPKPDPEPQDPPPNPEPQDPEPQDPEPQDPPPNPDPRPSNPPSPDPDPEPQPSGRPGEESTTTPPPPSPSSTPSDASTTTDRPGPSSDDESSSESSSTSRRSEGVTSIAVDVITITSDGEIFTSTRTSTHFLPPSETGISLPVEPTDSPSSKTNTGAIAGGVVGGIGALAILAALAVVLWKRRSRKQQEKEFDGNFDPVYVSRGSTSISHGHGGVEAGGGSGSGVEEKASWRKSLGLRSGAIRASQEPDAPRVEDATLPRIDLDDPPVPVNPFMSERGDSGSSGGILVHSTGSSASHLPPIAAASSVSFGVNGAPMGMRGHADSSGSPIHHHSRAMSLHSAASSPLVEAGTGMHHSRALSLHSAASSPGTPPLPPPTAR